MRITNTYLQTSIEEKVQDIMKCYQLNQEVAQEILGKALCSAVVEEPLFNQIHFLITGELPGE